MTEDKKKIRISRYSSRRLYNTGAGEYVTVKDIAGFIRNGHDVEVTDKKSGQDITAQILLQIIAEQEAESGSVLPANVLTDIIRAYSSETKNLIPDFLSESFRLLKDHRRRISGSLKEQIANPLDPQKAIASLDAWREAQQDILQQMFTAWLPTPRAGEGKEQATPADEKDQSADVAEELSRLKEQVEALQSRLDKDS